MGGWCGAGFMAQVRGAGGGEWLQGLYPRTLEMAAGRPRCTPTRTAARWKCWRPGSAPGTRQLEADDPRGGKCRLWAVTDQHAIAR